MTPPRPDILRRKAGKVRVDLVPPGVMEAIAAVMSQVLDQGLKGEDDWFVLLNDPPLVVERQMAAAIVRHALRILAGEEFDEETGLPHVHHILTDAAMAGALLYEREAVARLESRGEHFFNEADHSCTCPHQDAGEPAGNHDISCPARPFAPPAYGVPRGENTWTSDLQEERPSWLDTHAGHEAAGTAFSDPAVRRHLVPPNLHEQERKAAFHNETDWECLCDRCRPGLKEMKK